MAARRATRGSNDAFDQGPPPPAKPGEDVPRWVYLAGVAVFAAIMLFLVRYAIDLAGVVFLIVLFVFSTRAVSEWFTDGDSASGWAAGGVSVGVFGTLLIGAWLFGPSRLTGNAAFEGGVRTALSDAVGWAESHGWGRRALIPGGPIDRAVSSSAPSGSGSASAPGGGFAGGGAVGATGGPGTLPSMAETRAPGPGARSPGGAPAGRTARSQAPPTTRAAAGTSQEATPTPAAVVATAAPIDTTTVLSVSSPTSRVGTSVRLTARVAVGEGDPLPHGTVIFRRGSIVLGTAQLVLEGGAASASLSVLELPIGTHELVAEYAGADRFTGSRSHAVTETVAR